jgi:hypothetical protein
MMTLAEFINTSSIFGGKFISKLKQLSHPKDYMAAIKHMEKTLKKSGGTISLNNAAFDTALIYRNTEPTLLRQAYLDTGLGLYGARANK